MDLNLAMTILGSISCLCVTGLVGYICYLAYRRPGSEDKHQEET